MTSRADPPPYKAWIIVAILAAPFVALLSSAAIRRTPALLGHLLLTVLPMQLGYSLVAAAGGTLLAALLAAGGLSCALFEFPGRSVLQKTLLLPWLVPGWFLAVMLRELLGMQGVLGLVLVVGISSAPLAQLFGSAALRSLPGRYTDVLRLLGRDSPLRLLRTLLPLAAPALAAAALIVSLIAWTDVASARTMAVPTLTVGMLDQWFGREDTSLGAALGLVLASISVPLGFLLWWGMRRTGWRDDARLAARPPGRTPLKGYQAALPWLLSIPQLIAGVLVPGAIIALWTSQRLERVNLSFLGSDIYRSLLVAFAATGLAALIAMPVVHASALSKASLAGKVASLLGFALFAMPPSVLALAMLLTFPSKADRGITTVLSATALPLVAGLGLRFCGVFVAAALATLRRQAHQHVALLRVLGRADLGSFLDLLRSFLVRPVAAAAAFVFLESLQDLALPLVLQPFGFNTMSTRVFQYAQTQQVRDCAVWVLCLGLVGIYPLFTLARMGESSPDAD